MQESWVLIPGSEISPGEGNGKSLQYSRLENPIDRGAWWATVHGIARVGHDWATKPPTTTIHHRFTISAISFLSFFLSCHIMWRVGLNSGPCSGSAESQPLAARKAWFQPFLSVQFSGVQRIHNIVPPSLSVSRTFHYPKQKLCTHKWHLLIPPFPPPLVTQFYSVSVDLPALGTHISGIINH